MDPREALLETLLDPRPPLVGGWPLAPGWWLLIALVLIGLGALAVALWRRRARSHRALAWQRAAHVELAAMRGRLDRDPPAELLAAASVLARRVLLAVRPRTDVASLNGAAWLAALDAASGGTRFTEGPARRLASGPFERAPAVSRDEIAEVVDALDELVGTLARRRSGDEASGGSASVPASRSATLSGRGAPDGAAGDGVSG